MSIDNFVPTVWAGEILRALEKTHVFASSLVINRDYEGEISAMGDSVRINSIGDVTIKDYTKNTPIDDPEVLDDASQVLIVDQAKYFNFFVDNVDKVQQNPKVMGTATERASYSLRDRMDAYLASFYTDIAPTNFIGTDGVPKVITTASDAYEYLVDLGTLLNEQDVPKEGRWAIIPPWLEGLLLKDDRFVSFGTVGNNDTLTNGRIGRAAGFDLSTSNNISNVGGARYKIMAGHPMGWSMAEQIIETVAYKPEKYFGDAVKGLNVYGAKVVRPNALACLVASRS